MIKSMKATQIRLMKKPAAQITKNTKKNPIHSIPYFPPVFFNHLASAICFDFIRKIALQTLE